MGGSILGSEAIYDFLNYKIKKKFHFFNNLQNYKNLKSKKKKIKHNYFKIWKYLRNFFKFKFNFDTPK